MNKSHNINNFLYYDFQWFILAVELLIRRTYNTTKYLKCPTNNIKMHVMHLFLHKLHA